MGIPLFVATSTVTPLQAGYSRNLYRPPGVASAAGSRAAGSRAAGSRAAAPRHSIHTTTQPGPAAGLIRDGKVGMRNYRSRSRGRWRVIYNADTG